MIDLQHEAAALAALAEDARIYLRPTGFVDGPLLGPDAVVRLAGGPCWFAAVHVMARRPGQPRQVSCLVGVRDIDALIAGLREPQKVQAQRQWQALRAPRPPLDLLGGARRLPMDRPQIMGILNVTPDSFSDGGAYAGVAEAVAAGFAMADAGAAIIDIGAESTRPGAEPVWEQDEIARLTGVVEPLAAGGQLVSLDTRKAAVMRFGLAAGVAIINDVSALGHDDEALPLLSGCTVPVVLMHAQGDPRTMQDSPRYADALLDVFDWLEARLAACAAAGITLPKPSPIFPRHVEETDDAGR